MYIKNMSIKFYSKNTHTKHTQKKPHKKYPICSSFPYIFWLENS